jgi:hypothetical protein
MPTNTYEKIQTVTVGSGGQSEIEFTSIPSTYTDLIVQLSVRTNTSGTERDSIGLRINSDTGSNYTWCRMYGYTSSSKGADSQTTNYVAIGGLMPAASADADTFAGITFHFYNYASTSIKKLGHWMGGGHCTSTNWVSVTGSFEFNSTSAITSIKFYNFDNSSSLFTQHSSATLFGIKNS